MNEIDRLLRLSQDAALIGLEQLRLLDEGNVKQFSLSSSAPREYKAKADFHVEKILISELSSSGLSILSEESGLSIGNNRSALRFIIDPIDGTVNFLRGISNCSISIALFENDLPVFGVIASYPTGDIAWGGKELGAFLNNERIKVSSICIPEEGVLCTGFPSRFKFNSETVLSQMNLMAQFGKVRMLGAASQSLLQVAKGAVDCYYEKEIMLWDVAAGIAIVEGAGGRVMRKSGGSEFSLDVMVDNGMFDLKFMN